MIYKTFNVFSHSLLSTSNGQTKGEEFIHFLPK